MKPSVLAVCFFSTPGAVADNFHTLCSAQAGQSRLSVLTSRPLEGRPIPGVEAACYLDTAKQQPLRWLSPAFWRRVVSFARHADFDLVFLYSEHPLHVAVQRTARARRSLFWCLDPTRHTGGRALFAAVYEMAKRSLLHRSTRVVVACQALTRHVIADYGVPPARVFANFHGTLDNLVLPDLRPAAGRDIDILFFGRLYRYKGIETLLEALSHLRARGGSPSVTIAGDGPFAVPPTPGVTLHTRYLPDRELATLVARARIVVMPYRDATGSQVPQTAFAYGTPVVATAVGCLPEYVEDGVTGLVVPPDNPLRLAEALDRLLSNGDLWQQMSQAAEARARTTFDNGALTARLLKQALVD